MPGDQPVREPLRAASGRLHLDQRDPRRAFLWRHSAAQRDECAVVCKLNTVGRLAVWALFCAHTGVPGGRVDRVVCFVLQDRGPPAQALPGEAVGGQRPAFLFGEALGEVDAEGGVCHVPQPGVVNVQRVQAVRGHAPLVPGVVVPGIFGADLPASPEHVPGAAGVGGSACVYDLARAGGRGRQRRHDGVHLVVGQLLRLVINDQGDPCEASGTLPAPGGELDAPAVLELDALLAVGVPDISDEPLDLRVSPVGEHLLQPPEALLRGHDLVRRVQDFLAFDDQPEELPGLQADVLAVLPGCGEPCAGHRVAAGLVFAEPAVHDRPLPVRQGDAVGLHEGRGCRSVAAAALRLDADPRLLASGHSANFSRTRSSTVTFSCAALAARASPRTVS